MHVSRQTAARFLLSRQGLLCTDHNPLWRCEFLGESGAMQVISMLECVQVDPVNVLERNQHLALAARVGEYRPEHAELLLAKSELLDYICNARCFVPMDDWPLLKPITAHLQRSLQSEVKRLGNQLELVYQEVATNGPISSRQLDNTEKIVGWWDNKGPKTKVSSMALEVLWHLGRIGICKREANERFFASMERVVPQAVQKRWAATSMDDAEQGLARKYMRAHRLFYPGNFRFSWMRKTAAEKQQLITHLEQKGDIVPVHIDGVRRVYWALAEDAADLAAADAWHVAPEATLLPPLDNLLWLRDRLVDLFGFEYTWEIYVPQAKRKYGNYTMPLLVGDRFYGRLDAHMDRKTATLFLDAFHAEEYLQSMPHSTQRAALRPAQKAVAILATVCRASNINVSATAGEQTKWLAPS